MNRYLPVLIIPLIISCSVSRNYDPNKKYAKEELQQDYTLLRNILQKTAWILFLMKDIKRLQIQ